MPYQVHLRAPAEAERDLLRVWRDNLTLEGTAEEKFAWLYRKAPELPDTVLLLTNEPEGEGSDGGEVVGSAGIGIRQFLVDNKPERVGLLADLAVDRAHRSVAPALALVRRGKEFALGRFAFAYGFPNRLAEGVFLRAGYRRLGLIERYVRVLRHASYLERVGDEELARLPAQARPLAAWALASAAGRSAVGAGLDLAGLARGGMQLLSGGLQVDLRWPAPVDENVDAIWRAARGEYPVIAARTAQFLEWRFFSRAGPDLVVARDRRSKTPVAYAVVEQTHVRDLFGTRQGVLALLDQLPVAAYRRGAQSLSMRYLGQGWLTDALAKRGFVTRGVGRTIVVAARAGLPDSVAAALADAKNWHLTDADEDT